MSNYAMDEQEKHAHFLSMYVCVRCRDRAMFLAQRELFERDSQSSAFAICGIALDKLERGEIKPCQNKCANSGWQTGLDAARQAMTPMSIPAHTPQYANYDAWSLRHCVICNEEHFESH